MKAPKFSYIRAESLDQVLGLLYTHGEDARILAGGQSLMPTLNMRLSQPKLVIDINRLENEADTILRRAVARLFDEEKNAITIIKWKEIYENLESAADRCEDVANIIEGLVLEHS